MRSYKGALVIYEAILKLIPDDVEALAGLALLLVYSCQYPLKQTWSRALHLLTQAQALDSKLQDTLKDVEDNCFSWNLFLHPRDANALGNYAVFMQCIHHEFDKAELLYRRAIDLDPSNEMILENYRRLERERAPDGIYHFAGPGRIALWRAKNE
uniref:Uncharacterized protein n=1 Tax=Globisporangium ultimum (strain ATCC 200006 / CBS 805.95 / DAOM BR144) TaxID=431595 RepID=K3WKX2_GLOUD